MKEFFLYLSSTLPQYFWYWRLNYFFKRLRFSINKHVFKFRYVSTETRSDISVLRGITLLSVSSVLSSVLIGFGIIFISSFLRQNSLSTYHSSLIFIDFIASSVSEQQQSAYDGILVALITITGIFLTLYLTNINTVAGTLYARLPTKLRDLVVDDKVGNVYIRSLIQLTLLSLFFLGYGVVTGYRPVVVVILISVTGLLAIRAFLQLSARSFSFFDPTTLGMVLLWKLQQWVDQSKITGYLWQDNTFQNHYRQQAADTLSSVSALVEVAHEENILKREPLTNLLRSINYFLTLYIPKKRLIPSDSYWYIRKPKYQSWFLSDSTAVGLATQTQTDVQPDMEPDHNWIESEFLQMDQSSIEKTLRDGRTRVAITILDTVTKVFNTFGSEWNVDLPSRELKTVFTTTKKYLDNSPHSTSQLTDQPEQFKEHLALVDYLGLLPIELLLGLIKGVENIDLKKIENSIDTLDWSNKKSIYKLSLPSSTLATLEDICRRVNFEKLAEGKVITAKWYIKQLVFQSLAINLHEQIDFLLSNSIDLYLSALNWKNKEYVLYGVTLQAKGGEFRNKFLAHLHTLQQFAATLDEGRTESSIPWPNWDWTAWTGCVEKLFDELTVFYAESIDNLVAYSDMPGFPDYFGRAVHMIGEECFRAIVKNNTEQFSKIFQHYFIGVLMQWDVLGKKTEDWNMENALLANSQPILDLCELSGYCYLFAEFHQNPELWKKCKQVWDGFFRQELREKRLVWFDALLSFNSDYNFFITNRSMLRSQWEMYVNQKLNSIERKYVPTSSMVSYTVADHPSLLVRVIAGHDEMPISLYTGLDIFIDLYLSSLPEASNLKFGSRHMLADSLKRREGREADDLDELIE